jgi:hypothetical protein
MSLFQVMIAKQSDQSNPHLGDPQLTHPAISQPSASHPNRTSLCAAPFTDGYRVNFPSTISQLSALRLRDRHARAE